MELSRNSPFVAEWVTNARKSLAPKHIGGVHQNYRTIVFHRFDHCITVINVQMNRNTCSAKACRAWRATVFRQFFADEESRGPNTKFTVHDTPVWHVKQ